MHRIVLLAIPLVTAPVAGQSPRGSLDAFDAYVADAVGDWRVPGLAVAIVKDGVVEFAKGYGVREIGSADRVTEHTLFANASTTKAFVAMAAAMLVGENRLDWDDRVVDHVPHFRLGNPEATANLTVRHLFSHQTGFGDPSYLWYGVPHTLDTMVHRLRYIEPESGWTTGYAYNNVTYALGGAVVAKITGKDWESVVDDRILKPLGMDRTATNTNMAARYEDIATPHYILDDSVKAIERYHTDNIGAAGAMYSSVVDMTRWLTFMLDSGVVDGDALIPPDVFATLLEPQTLIERNDFYPTYLRTAPFLTAYGLGWFIQDYGGEKIAFHTGSIDGFVAIAGLVPSERLGVIVFANLDHAEVRHALMLRVFDMYLGRPDRDWSTELLAMYDSLAGPGREARREFAASRQQDAGPSRELAAYVGDYHHPLYGTAHVTLRDDTLTLARSHFLIAELTHWHYDVFRAEWHRPWVTTRTVNFDLDINGEVRALRIDGFRLERR